MRYAPLIAALAATLCLLGCGNRTRRAVDGELPPKRNAQRLLAEVDRQLYVAPAAAEMKGDLRIESPDLTVKLAATIRTHADSALWFTLRKFGIEGARGLITRDSAFVVNRLEREALVASAGDLPEEARGLPIAPTLANLLAAFGGGVIGDFSEARVGRVAGGYVLAFPGEQAAVLEVSAAPTVPQRWSYREGEDFGEVTFADFREVADGRIFPFFRTLRYSDSPGDTTAVTLALDSYTPRDALAFPISIPEDYAPMSL